MTLKNVVWLFVFVLLMGCGSDDENEDTIPSTFTQKVLFEKISRESCGLCPATTRSILNFIDGYADRAFSVSVQINDALTVPHGDRLFSLLAPFGGSFGLPMVSINRDFNGSTSSPIIEDSNDWGPIVDRILAEEAIAGLAINSTVNGNTIDIDVSFTSNEPIDDAFLTVYLYENDFRNPVRELNQEVLAPKIVRIYTATCYGKLLLILTETKLTWYLERKQLFPFQM